MPRNYENRRVSDPHACWKYKRGTQLPQAKLDDAKVREIRSRYRVYCTVNGADALAIAYGVSKSTIEKVLSGQAWKHVR